MTDSNRQVFDLTPEDEDALNSSMETIWHLLETMGVTPENPADVLGGCDAVVKWWKVSPPESRPARESLIQGLGGVLGCLITGFSSFEWKRVVDAYGDSVCLVAESGDEQAVLSPIDSVGKRFDSDRESALSEYFVGLVDMEHLRRHFDTEFLEAMGPQ